MGPWGLTMDRRCVTVRVCLTLVMVLWWPASLRGQTERPMVPERVTGELVLTGQHRVDGPVTVEKEGPLTLERGSKILFAEGGGVHVHGKLVVLGTEGSPVDLGPVADGKWKGLALYQGARAEIRGLRLQGAETALSVLAAEMVISGSEVSGSQKGLYLVREAKVEAEGLRLVDNQVGLAAEMKSTARIKGCVFEGNRVGLGIASGARPVVIGNRFSGNGMALQISQRYPETVKGNLFSGNKVAVRLYQNGPDTVLEGNLFAGNEEAAIQVLSFSSPAIRNNRIVGGGFGLFANQFSSPVIVNNAFEDLREAIHLTKKSGSRVAGNTISGSGIGLFLDFSSYPLIRENVFDGNETHIKLGRFQSSHWEASAGSKRYVLQAAARVGSRNPKLAEGPEDFPEAVDAAGNHWDKATTEEMRQKGSDADITSLYDGYDLPRVTYEGFGEQEYRLDRIVYQPYLDSPPPGSGLKGWKGKEDELGLP